MPLWQQLRASVLHDKDLADVSGISGPEFQEPTTSAESSRAETRT